MIDPEIAHLRASHQRLCDEYAALVADVIAMLGAMPTWPRNAAERVAIEGVRARIGLGPIPEPTRDATPSEPCCPARGRGMPGHDWCCPHWRS